MFKYHNYDLSIECYTLSLNYTPENESDLLGIIYSNRSFAYLKKGNSESALTDAQNCARIKPEWPKVSKISPLVK